MIFDILKIGATLTNNSLTDDAHYYNDKLYTIPEFTAGISKNINVYDISDYKSTSLLERKYPLYDSLDVSKYILIQTDGEYSSSSSSSNVRLISTDMSRYYHIDTDTNTAQKEYINETINTTNFNSDKLYSKTIYHNNKVYSIPYNTSNIGIYDTITTSNYLCNIDISGNELFSSGIINNNKLYLIPYNYSNVLVYDIDPIRFDKEITINVNTNEKYSHVVEHNNNIYCIPFNADHILKIDKDDIIDKIHNDILESPSKYSYGVLDTNRIYLIPADNQKIAYYDIINEKIHELPDIMFGDRKFSSGVKIDDKIYLIPHNFDKIVTIDANNTVEQLFSFTGIRHPKSISNTLFSEAYHDNNTLYMIPDNCGYIGVLKYPYDSINRFYTIDIFLDQEYDINKSIIGHYYDTSLHLMSSGYHEPVVDIILNKKTYNLQSFNGDTTITKDHEKDINSCNFIFRNYVSGIYYNECFYLLEASGKYITKIDTDYITDIEIYTDKRKGYEYRNEINFNNIVKVGDLLYTVIGNNNIFSKYNIVNKEKEYLDLQQYNFTSTDKFKYGLYSQFSDKVYLIPYNIPKIGIIDNKNNITYIELDNLKDINSLFQFAIENNGYIYLIPYSSDFIFILNVVDNKLSKIDISVYNSLNKKFVKAFKYDKKIIIVSSDFDKLVFLDYDLLPGATLEDNANFNLITKNLFKSDGNTDVIDIGINTQYSATYRNGRLFINLRRDNAEDTDIYNWSITSSILVDKDKGFNIQDNKFIDDNEDIIFTIDDPDEKFNIDELLTDGEIQKTSVTNIYSLSDNSIYFIPYNYKYLLKLDLSQTPNVLKIIDIAKDQNTLFINFMTDGSVTGKFNLAIIIDDMLYMIPYVEEASINYYPLVKYDIINNSVISITDLNEFITFGLNSRELFSSVLKYNNLLYLTQQNGNKVMSYNIVDNTVNNITIESAINCFIIDGYINDGNIYFLKNDGSKLIKYTISESGNFTGRTPIDIGDVIDLGDPPNLDIYKYSKIISNQSGTKLYLIPYNTNELCIYSFDDPANPLKKEISRYGTDGQLFKGGLIITLEDNEYLIMIPYKADRVCIYNITDGTFTFIKDPLFTTNDFENCTIDLHGNLCMNTAKGNVLFYKLSIKKEYKETRKPVKLSTNSRISFKDLYQKFHTDYIYEGYNFANKSIKFSDYFNNGGSTYFTMGKFKKDKYIIDNNDIIPDAKYTESITSYDEFIQCNVDNKLELSEYRSAHSAVYENYILLDNNEYNISSISISNGYFYYVEQNNSGEIRLKGKKISNYNNIGNPITITVTEKIAQDILPNTYNLINYPGKNELKNTISGTSSENTYYKIIIEVDETDTHTSKLELSMSDFDSDKFKNLQEIEFDIYGTLAKGIEININDTIGDRLKTITVLNNPSGVIKFDDGLNNLITINSPSSITDPINVNLKESIDLEELEVIVDSILKLQNLETTITDSIDDESVNNNDKVSKIIVKIDHIPTSDTSTSLNLFNISDRVPYCHTLVIITKSDKIYIDFTGNNIKNNLNVIVYENI